MCIFYGTPADRFVPGAYTVEIYTDGLLTGRGQALLR
jgi:hypothetical protein